MPHGDAMPEFIGKLVVCEKCGQPNPVGMKCNHTKGVLFKTAVDECVYEESQQRMMCVICTQTHSANRACPNCTGRVHAKKVVSDLPPDWLDDLMDEVNAETDGDIVTMDNMKELLNEANDSVKHIVRPARMGLTEDRNVIPRNKYMREVAPGIWIDVYDIIDAFDVTDGGMQHALKKILACGSRGHKDEEEDRSDILASIVRSNEIFDFKRLEK